MKRSETVLLVLALTTRVCRFVTAQSALYKATRARVLSPHNPYWFSGSAGAGVGGPHVGMGQIWPMGIIVQALTSDDDEEIAKCLQTLRSTTAGTFFMHESFDKDDCHKFSRPWSVWVPGYNCCIVT